MKKIKYILLLNLFFSLSIHLSANYGFGIITPKPSKSIKKALPFIDYLRSQGLPISKIIVAPTLKKMIVKIKNGEVGFVSESPYGAYQIIVQTKSIPILIRQKKGEKEYNSAIFVRKDSSIKKIKDLKGKLVAFEDLTSTSGFLLPSALIKRDGLSLIYSSKKVAGKVAYYFARNENNLIISLTKRRIDAFGTKSKLIKKHPEFRILLPVSPFVPRNVIVASSKIDIKSLKKVLLGMAKDPLATKALKKLKTKKGFIEYQGDFLKYMKTDVKKSLGL